MYRFSNAGKSNPCFFANALINGGSSALKHTSDKSKITALIIWKLLLPKLLRCHAQVFKNLPKYGRANLLTPMNRNRDSYTERVSIDSMTALLANKRESKLSSDAYHLSGFGQARHAGFC